MRQDERAPFDRALRRAREAAGAPGEGFMSADEICALARQAAVGPGVAVLDVCCGVGGPGRLIAHELGCDYLGVDSSESAIAIACEDANGCRFEVGSVPPLPDGGYDVVLMLEAMLAFEDKEPLVRGIAAALRPGGRFAFTVEAGAPLTAAERAAMPDADTVWLTPLGELTACLQRAGLAVTSLEDRTREHRAMAQAMAGAFTADAAAIAAQVGCRALDDLLSAHGLWIDWLGDGRVRKLALVAELRARPPQRRRPGPRGGRPAPPPPR